MCRQRAGSLRASSKHSATGVSVSKVYYISQKTQSGRQRAVGMEEAESRPSETIQRIITKASTGAHFCVLLTDRGPSAQRKLFHINRYNPREALASLAIGRPAIEVVDEILRWAAEREDFRITILERVDEDDGPRLPPSPASARLHHFPQAA